MSFIMETACVHYDVRSETTGYSLWGKPRPKKQMAILTLPCLRQSTGKRISRLERDKYAKHDISPLTWEVQEVLAFYERSTRYKVDPERPEKQLTIETYYPTPKIIECRHSNHSRVREQSEWSRQKHRKRRTCCALRIFPNFLHWKWCV